MERNEKYFLLAIKKRTSKEGKEYYLAYVGIDNDFSYDLVNVLIKEEQVDDLLQYINEDITEFIQIEYNTYLKAYKPIIKL